jgi:hypothetical protein
MAANTIAEARAFNIGRLLNTSMLPIKSMMNTMMAAMKTGSNQVYSDGKNMFERPTNYRLSKTRRPEGRFRLEPALRVINNYDRSDPKRTSAHRAMVLRPASG